MTSIQDVNDNLKEENIHTAILKVMKDVKFIQKEAGPGYSIKTEEGVIAAIRPSMIVNNIIMIPNHIGESTTDQYTNHKGTLWNRVTMLRTFKFLHVPSDTSVIVHAMGEGIDTGDKGGGKAMTYAKKYALLELFLIQTGDDPDKFASPDDEVVKHEWSSDQIKQVLDYTYLETETEAQKFLNYSLLSHQANAAIKVYCQAFQGRYDELEGDENKKSKAIAYAKSVFVNAGSSR